jgi:IS5 family transposase
MKYRNPKKDSDLFSMIDHQREITQTVRAINKLSDEQTEFQIGDRFSFMQFLGLQPGDSVPDEKTIWDFKGLLDRNGRDGARKLFECFASQLSGEGMIAREGCIVDASFVDAPRQLNTREQNKAGERPEGFEADTAKGRQKDCDARWTKKIPKRITVTRTTPRWMRRAS